MNTTLHITLGWQDWLNLFWHYLLLSAMSFGGAIAMTSEMHRFLVEQHGWLTQAQFNDAIAIAQAAPGPNVLFVALMGWQVGMNAGSLAAAWLGAATTLTGMLLPSTILTYQVAQWLQRNRERRAVRAFKLGMAPVVIALLLSTAWILANPAGGAQEVRRTGLLALVSCLVIWRTRLNLLWLLAAGASLGALGIV